MPGVNITSRIDTVVTNASTPNQTAQVVIVGAGLAGLAAAQRLYEAGIRDVIVLDAQDRVGGRVHTINYSDYVIELGAQWLHGADENPLHKWLVEKNMLNDFEDASLGFTGLFCTNKGKEIDQGLVKRVLEIVVEIKLSLSKNHYVDVIRNNGFENAGDVFKHQLNIRIESDEELMKNKTLVYAIFDWFMRYETVDNCCDSMEEVSITSYTDWTDFGDGTLLNFKNGYQSLLYWFCDQMPSKRLIYLNKQVINIEMLKLDTSNSWSDDEGCQFNRPLVVKYIDNQPTNEFKNEGSGISIVGLIECDHVIVTVSLGFLKKNHETLFKPPLPDIKRELISTMGFGTVNKIILQFESPFWDNDHGIKLVWEDRDRENFPEWVYDIITFDTVRNQPNLLIGWIGGYGAKLMEKESDARIAETCSRILKKFLPPTYKKPSRLLSCISSRWNSNPFFCGSYSFQSIKSFNQKVDKLHEPLSSLSSSNGTFNNDKNNKLVFSSTTRVPRVLFAGEATAGKLYSTTHGAIMSGWREADRLSDHLLGMKKVNIHQVGINSSGIGSNNNINKSIQPN